MSNQDQQGESISNRTLYVVSLNHFVNDSSTYLISSLFPAMILAFSFSEFQIGILVAVGYLVNLIFQPLTGRYSERYEARKLLALGISLIAVAMILLTIFNTFALILLSILILRFGSSFFHPVGVSAVSRAYSGSKLESSMGFQSAFGNLGIVMAFLLSAPAYLSLGWRGPFLIYAALEFAVVAITLISLRAAKKRNSLAVYTDTGGGESQADGNEQEKVQTSDNGERKYRFGLPYFFIAAPFISGGCYAIFGNFGNLFLFHNGFGLTFSNYLVAMWVVSAFIGAILTGRLTRMLSRRRLLLLSYLISGLATFVFAFSYHDILLALSSLLLNGFMISITYPATYSELSSFLGRSSMNKGTAFGILFSGQIAGSSALGFLSGYVAGIFGLRLTFEMVGVLLVSSVFIVLLWSQNNRGLS